MFLVRDIMYCKPGKARAMVEKFLTLARLADGLGFRRMRVMTDMSAERYWTVVAEAEVESLEAYTEQSRGSMDYPAVREAMQGYHDLIDHGRREIYLLEN